MKEKLPITFISILSIFIVRSLILPGFVPTHDGEYHIIRLWQFDKNIQEGNLFPIWAPDLNNDYGIPLFEFFYPLPNYIGEFFHILGFSFVDSVRLVLASGLIFSGVFFYFWMRCFFDKKFSLLGSFLYMLAPYHLVDVFIRGSVGEVWSLAIAPLSLFLITKNVKEEYKNNSVKLFVPISLCLLLLSHNILGIVFFIFNFIYGLIMISSLRRKLKLAFFSDFIFGLLLSFFFWLPILFEEQFVSGLEIINYKDHFPALFQLIFPSWGSGFSVPGISDQMSFQIGIPHLIIVSLVFLYYLVKRKKDFLLFFFLTVFILTFFLLTESSVFIWQAFPLLAYFQYPWRLLSIIIVVSSFLSGYLSKFKFQRPAFFALLSLALISYLPYTKPVVYDKRSDNFYLKNNTWTKGGATLGDTFNTIWLAKNTLTYRDKIQIIEGKGDIVKRDLKSTKYDIEVDNQDYVKMRVNTSYFPGWEVMVDQKIVDIDYFDGLINFFIPEGKHSIMVRLEDTAVRKLGKTISIISFSLMILLAVQQAGLLQKHAKGVLQFS